MTEEHFRSTVAPVIAGSERTTQGAPLSAASEGAGGRSLLLVATMMGIMLVTLDVSVVNVAVEDMQASLRIGIEGLQWVLNVYTLAYAVFLLSAGALGDRIGPRATFLLGFAVFTASSLACGLAPSYPMLLASRLAQGIGAALLVPSAMSLLRQAYPDPSQRASAIGLWAGAGSFALAAGPVIGGALITAFGWRSIFLVNMPLGLLGVWFTLRNAPQPERVHRHPIDLAGQLTAAAMLACLTGAITQGNRLGWTSMPITAALLAAPLLAAGLIVIEARSAHPMMPLALFRSRSFSAASYVGFAANVAFYGMVFVFSLFFQSVQGRSPLATGLAFVPMTGIIMLVNVSAGRLNTRFGARGTMMMGLALASAGYLASLAVDAHATLITLGPAFLLIGGGIAMVVPSLMIAALAGMSSDRAGIGSGVHNAARQVGGAMGVALFGSLVSSAGSDGFVTGLRVAILIAAGTLASAFAVTFVFVPKIKRL